MIKRNANVNVRDQKAMRRLIMLAAIVLVGGGLLCWGAAVGIGALRGIWQEQFRVQDAAIDVVVTSSGANVMPETITFHFGLTNGANLAAIPYEEKSRELIERNPNIRSIAIERRLPRRVTVDVKEREPAVRIATTKGSESSGLVADYDGIVFRTFKAPSQLPVVRASVGTRHVPGQRLEGHAYAALQLVHVLADAADGKSDASKLASLRVREINTSKKDYLLMTLDDYSTAEIAWARMGEESDIAQKSLRRQLVHLAQAIAARLTPRATRWIVTEYEKGGRVYAADPARLGER